MRILTMYAMKFGILAASLTFGADAIAQSEQSRTEVTRFGTVRIDEDGIVYLNGKSTNPAISAQHIDKAIKLQNEDVIIAYLDGGRACPVSFFFISLSRNEVAISSVHGSCSEDIEVKVTGERVVVAQRGYAGPFNSQAEQIAAAKKKNSYAYYRGGVYENSKKQSSGHWWRGEIAK